MLLPFAVSLKPGESPYRQIVYAATRAIVSGELAPGASFPSVRELSQALRISPNTAQKVVAELVRDGLLEVRPGIGTVVTAKRKATTGEKKALLSGEVEQLVVEAKRLGITKVAVVDAVLERWAELFGEEKNSK